MKPQHNSAHDEAEKHKLNEMEMLIYDQQAKIQRQESQIDDLRKMIQRLECERNTNSAKTNVIAFEEVEDLQDEERQRALVKRDKSCLNKYNQYSDALEQARNESILEGNDWRTALIDDLVKIISKYPSTLPEVSWN